MKDFAGVARINMVEVPNLAAGSQGGNLREAIAKARAGDSNAWGEIYREHAAAVYRLCRRVLPSREDAEDATMEIFLKVREKLGQYDAGRPFRAWLYKVAANHCWDQLRRRRVRKGREAEDIEDLPLEHPDASQLEQLVVSQTRQEVRGALGELPGRARMALVLRYYAEMSYDEIAEALAVPRGFVGVVLLRARHQLREILKQRPRRRAAGGGFETRPYSTRGEP